MKILDKSPSNWCLIDSQNETVLFHAKNKSSVEREREKNKYAQTFTKIDYGYEDDETGDFVSTKAPDNALVVENKPENRTDNNPVWCLIDSQSGGVLFNANDRASVEVEQEKNKYAQTFTNIDFGYEDDETGDFVAAPIKEKTKKLKM